MIIRLPRVPCPNMQTIDVSDSHSVASHPVCPSRARPVCADQPTDVEPWHIGNDRSTAALDPCCTHNEYDTAAHIHGRCSRTSSSGSCASPRIRGPPCPDTPSVRPRRAYAGDVCQDAELGVVGALRVDSWSTARSWCVGPAIRNIPPAQPSDMPQRFMMARAASSLSRVHARTARRLHHARCTQGK